MNNRGRTRHCFLFSLHLLLNSQHFPFTSTAQSEFGQISPFEERNLIPLDRFWTTMGEQTLVFVFVFVFRGCLAVWMALSVKTNHRTSKCSFISGFYEPISSFSFCSFFKPSRDSYFERDETSIIWDQLSLIGYAW